MKDVEAIVTKNEKLTSSVNLVTFHAPAIAPLFLAGQFLEVQISNQSSPLLRRPYSIHWVEGEFFQVMNKVVGVGSSILYEAREHDTCNILAPLGNTFGYDEEGYDIGVMVSGGIGVAPMALLQKTLLEKGKSFINLVGGRTKEDIIITRLENVHIATDDGSLGFKGNVVALFKEMLPSFGSKRVKVFSCGPNKMLSALSDMCEKQDIDCEVAIESIMGCGVGICYGCPIKIYKPSGDRPLETTLKLLCKDGTVFKGKEVAFN